LKILRIPSYWTAEQADTIHEFLGELQAAVWQAYHADIQQMYDEIKTQSQTDSHDYFDDEIDF